MVTLLEADFGGVNGDDKVFVTGGFTRFIEMEPWPDLLLLIAPPCCKDCLPTLLLILSDE